MRVTLCVDALEPEPGGIGRYTWELCKRLPHHPQISSLEFFARNRIIKDPSRLLRGERIYRGNGLARAIRGLEARRTLRTTLVHSPNYFLPRAAKTGVITVHDLSVFKYPETHPAERVRAFERLFADSLARARHIITDTEKIRAELLQDFSLRAEQVTAVPLGVDERFKQRTEDELAPVLTEMGLVAGKYTLCVSAIEPRKKLRELIQAWQCLPQRLQEEFPLVLAGGSGWRNDELHDLIKSASVTGSVRLLGFVPERSIAHLYSGAALFIYPSIYEGFGLPPLEAMASGVPVVVSGRSCLPEVCSDAARYIDPDDVRAFASVLEESLTDSKWRSDAVSRGLARAKQFTWERCVSETVLTYSKIY